MPAKNALKAYIENGCYHIYNRGVEKRDIFLDDRDYKVFLHLLKRYLTPPPPPTMELPMILPRFRHDLYDQIQLTAYCLMPNHFHLLVKQSTKDTITLLMRSLGNSYVYYFNTRYEREGSLFQGRYRAAIIETEPYLLHLTRYIHLNPFSKDSPRARTDPASIAGYRYSSYGEYLGKRKTEWIHPEEILAFFKTAQKTGLKDCLSYQSFVEDYLEDSQKILGPLALEK